MKNIYYKRRSRRLSLIALAIITFPLMIWYSNSLIDKIADDERNKIAIWANAIQRRSEVVTFTNNFFNVVAAEVETHANHTAKAYKNLITAKSGEDLSFYLDFIADNNTIPIIVVNEKNEITITRNLDSCYLARINTPQKLQEVIVEENYNKITINYHADKYVYLYYKESIIYTQLREILKGINNNFISEIANNTPNLPVIVTDYSQQKILLYSNINIDSSRIKEPLYIKGLIHKMHSKNEPIHILINGNTYVYVFYEESSTLKTLRLFPLIQLFLVMIFVIVAYFLLSFVRRSVQDRIWVGMAKETAHQLGTPLSSLMAWSEILENENVNKDIVHEINKDISRLGDVAQRFSKIGSIPKLEVENINSIINEFITYFQSRVSSSIEIKVEMPDYQIKVCMSKHLFEWVLENLCKNAIDAMDGIGTITVKIQDDKKFVYIDVSDTGKGIDTKGQRTIFEPGFTTKSRGWGLGLTLARRIINDYHNGKIELKHSAINKGSTFRIRLKKN